MLTDALNRLRSRKQSEDGFTLPELIMSVMIFSIVAVISISVVIAISESTKQSALDAESQVKMSNVASAMEGDINAAKSVWVKSDYQLVITNTDDSVIAYYPVQKGFNPSFSVTTKTRGTEVLNSSVVPTPNTVDLVRHTISSTGAQSAAVVYNDYLPIDVNNPATDWNGGTVDIKDYYDMFAVMDGTFAPQAGAAADSQRNDKKSTISISLKDYNNESMTPVSKRKIIAGDGETDSFMMP